MQIYYSKKNNAKQFGKKNVFKILRINNLIKNKLQKF